MYITRPLSMRYNNIIHREFPTYNEIIDIYYSDATGDSVTALVLYADGASKPKSIIRYGLANLYRPGIYNLKKDDKFDTGSISIVQTEITGKSNEIHRIIMAEKPDEIHYDADICGFIRPSDLKQVLARPKEERLRALVGKMKPIYDAFVINPLITGETIFNIDTPIDLQSGRGTLTIYPVSFCVNYPRLFIPDRERLRVETVSRLKKNKKKAETTIATYEEEAVYQFWIAVWEEPTISGAVRLNTEWEAFFSALAIENVRAKVDKFNKHTPLAATYFLAPDKETLVNAIDGILKSKSRRHRDDM